MDGKQGEEFQKLQVQMRRLRHLKENRVKQMEGNCRRNNRRNFM